LRNALQLPRFCADTPAPSFSFVAMSRVVSMWRLQLCQQCCDCGLSVS
jgi:hypothetical protein